MLVATVVLFLMLVVGPALVFWLNNGWWILVSVLALIVLYAGK